MHRTQLAVIMTAAVVLTACGEAVTGSGHRDAGTSSGVSASSFPADVAGLGALVLKGNRSIKSAHIELDERFAGTTTTVAGEELLSDGDAVALDLTEHSPQSGDVHFRIIGKRVYAQLPASMYKSSKPWVELSASTQNPVLKAMYGAFQATSEAGAAARVQTFVTAAKNMKLLGTQTLDGVEVGHYSLVVDVASLPATFQNKDALVHSGLTSIPVDLYVDARGVPRKVTETLTVAGQQVTALILLTKIDVPVTITAPPAGEIEHP